MLEQVSSCQPWCCIPEQPIDFGFSSCCWLFSFHGQTLEFLFFFLPAQSSDWPCDSAVDLGQCLTICAGPLLVCLQFQRGVGYSCATDDPARFITIYINFCYYHHLFDMFYSNSILYNYHMPSIIDIHFYLFQANRMVMYFILSGKSEYIPFLKQTNCAFCCYQQGYNCSCTNQFSQDQRKLAGSPGKPLLICTKLTKPQQCRTWRQWHIILW